MAPELASLNSYGWLASSRMRIDRELRVVAFERTKMFERTQPSKIEHFGDERCRYEALVARLLEEKRMKSVRSRVG